MSTDDDPKTYKELLEDNQKFSEYVIEGYRGLNMELKSKYDKVLNDFEDLAVKTTQKVEEFNDNYTPDPLVMRILLQEQLSKIKPLLTSTEDLGKWERLNRMVDENRFLSKEHYVAIKEVIDETFDL